MDLVGRAWTPEAVTFRKFCMSKRKNLDPWGRAPGTPSLDPPMLLQVQNNFEYLYLNANFNNGTMLLFRIEIQCDMFSVSLIKC